MPRLRILWLLLASYALSLNAAEVVKSGTGFAVSTAGHILTNAHVVSGCAQVTARIGGLEVPVQTASIDEQNDLALLKVSGSFSTILRLREGKRVPLGEPVIAFGYPLQGVISTSLNMTTGNVSALAGLSDDARSLQFTAPIQPGNSGGPLVDASGNVVGVVTSKLSPLWSARNIGDLPQNVNFALKASVIGDFLESRGVDYQAKDLGETIPITDLPGKVTGAILPLQCMGSGEAGGSLPATVSQTGLAEKRPGVLVAGHGPTESLQFFFVELQNALTVNGVLIANAPSALRQSNDDSYSIQNLLRRVKTQGSDSLLYLTVEHGWSNIHRAQIQCFNSDGKLLWEEKASSATTMAVTEQGAAKAVMNQLTKKIKSHLGKPGLPAR